MRIRSFLIPGLLCCLIACQQTKYEPVPESKAEKDARMEWWREARFGMFIHWGLYAVPAGEWNGETNHAEWIRTTAEIPLKQYDLFLDQFNPEKFNAEAWVEMAKSAGMKYIVITSKHHDGFALFDSKVSDFDVMATPFKRDILKELSVACKKEGIKLCFYHSIMDWHHPDYLPRRNWENDRSTEGAVFENYVKYMKKQLKELLKNYGDIGVLWFDGEWENTWTGELGTDLYHYVRSLQPSILINNRVGVGRAGMAGLTEEGAFGGDFGTPEQQIPATGMPGVDWETCMTMNNHWGYNKHDKEFKSSKDLVQKLVDIASKGGNFLLNIGPTSEGLFPSESIERLKDIGKWMDTNSESIYGTQASPFDDLPWGRCTQKSVEGGTRLYLHVFDWPENQKLEIDGLGNKIIRAYALADPDHNELEVLTEEGTVFIELPRIAPDPRCSVILLDIQGEPVIFKAPKIVSQFNSFTDNLEVKLIAGEEESTIHYTTDGSQPGPESKQYTGPFMISQTSTIKAICILDNKPITKTVQKYFEKVQAKPGRNLPGLKIGLIYNYYEGEWTEVPSYSGMVPKKKGLAQNFDLAGKESEEHFSIDYQGFINIETEGVYRFYLESDDGSILYVGEELLINNDGLHSASEKEAEIALSKGIHAIRISFFENTGGNSLRVSWEGPGISKSLIPGKNLFHF